MALHRPASEAAEECPGELEEMLHRSRNPDATASWCGSVPRCANHLQRSQVCSQIDHDVALRPAAADQRIAVGGRREAVLANSMLDYHSLLELAE
jgi:hypothetical protein